MINLIKENWKPTGTGILIGAGLSNEFTVDLIVPLIKIAVALL